MTDPCLYTCIQLSPGIAASKLNQQAMAAQTPWLLFLQPGWQLPPANSLGKVITQFAAKSACGGMMLRYLPGDIGYHVDPCTLQVPYLSGPAVFIASALFQSLGGFDARFSGPALMEELSWRIRAAGQNLYYIPFVVAVASPSNSAPTSSEDDTTGTPPPLPDVVQYAAAAIGKLLLSCKYGKLLQTNQSYWATMRHPQPMPQVRKTLLRFYLRSLLTQTGMLIWRLFHSAQRKAAASLYQQNTAACLDASRAGATLCQPFASGPKISVIVRTHARPQVLRGALQSLQNQSYRNFEIILVEDGPPTAQAMLEAEFSALPLQYIATHTHVGRSRAGNIGMQAATGDYLNLLDDDDYLYPDHLELMAAFAGAHPQANLILGSAMAQMVQPSSNGTPATITSIHSMRFDRIDLFTMSQMCQIPIQSAIFKRAMYLQYGGLQEGLNSCEDWAMWLRFLPHAQRANPSHPDIARESSIFTQFASPALEAQRQAAYAPDRQRLFDDPSIRFDVSLADMRQFYDGMLADMAHLQHTGQMDTFLQQNAARLSNATAPNPNDKEDAALPR